MCDGHCQCATLAPITYSTPNVQSSNCDALNCNVYQFHNSVYKFADISMAFIKAPEYRFELVKILNDWRGETEYRERKEKKKVYSYKFSKNFSRKRWMNNVCLCCCCRRRIEKRIETEANWFVSAFGFFGILHQFRGPHMMMSRQKECGDFKQQSRLYIINNIFNS